MPGTTKIYPLVEFEDNIFYGNNKEKSDLVDIVKKKLGNNLAAILYKESSESLFFETIYIIFNSSKEDLRIEGYLDGLRYQVKKIFPRAYFYICEMCGTVVTHDLLKDKEKYLYFNGLGSVFLDSDKLTEDHISFFMNACNVRIRGIGSPFFNWIDRNRASVYRDSIERG